MTSFPPLQAIVDVDTATALGRAPLDLLRAFLDGGARLVQLRAKRLPSGAFLDLCDAAVAMAAGYEARIIVNDRVDLARMSGAAGVHVGQDDLPPADVRQALGPTAIVGYSTHSVAQVDEALRLPITYLAIGPIFGTRSKDTGYAPVGLTLLAEVVARAGDMPIVAIGGITLDTAPAVIAAGAQAVAVIGDLLVDGDPAARVAAYLRRLSAR